MAISYGVLRGKPDRWVREAGASTPHLQIRVLDASGAAWRIAVNVQSDSGSEVVFWMVDPLLDHPILATLPALASGFTAAAHDVDHALDYVKAPWFDWSAGRALPASGSASADDLQDFLTLYLQQCHDAGGEVFAFGAKFDQNLHKPIDKEFGNTDGLHGIHDIHMNQGNPAASHAGDNGAFHDGGLLLSFGGRTMGLFLAFQSQRVPTDANGNPASGARALGDLIGGVPSTPQPPVPPVPPPTAATDVYLERALLNPSGDDAGHEVIVLGNLSIDQTALDGWTLVDKNLRTTRLDGLVVPGGGSTPVRLDGTGVQLGNGGGSIRLLDASGTQRDVAVYTGAQAKIEDRYLRIGG